MEVSKLDLKKGLALLLKERGRWLYGGLLLLVIGWFCLSLFSTDQPATPQGYDSASEYIEYYEKRLADALGKMEQVGRVQVLLSTDSSPSVQFEKDGSYQTDANADGTKKEQKEESTLVVRQNSSEQPIAVAQQLPRFESCLVICDGGDLQTVRLQVTESLKTLLRLPSNKIFVTKRKN